ncbi:MAG: AMP-binding protein [Pseudomonadota bacterium]
MQTLIGKLYRTRLFTPAGLFRLVEAVLTTGINLMALLRVAAKLHPQRPALVDDQAKLTYPELWQQAEALAGALHQEYGVQRGQRVAIACRNHAAGIKAIFAVSRLGAHVFLLNPEMSTDQTQTLVERLAIDFYIYDSHDGVHPFWLENSPLRHHAIPTYHATAPSIDQLASEPRSPKAHLRTVKTGNIVVMTGGTTGHPKPASRKPSIFNFLPPFMALLCQVHLDHYRSLYIATPIYHGFGLAALLIGVILGAELYITPRFKAEQACTLIAQHQIEVVTLVPLMLQRMLQHDPVALTSLQRILTGGAALRPLLAQDVLHQLGPIIFNLYGTSEAGFCLLGTPDLLSRKPASVGKPVRGVRAAVVHEVRPGQDSPQIGRLCIQSAWSTRQQSWIETGDLAYRDPEGDIFLCGRVDDMVVSGGENVYPIELENVVLQHPDIEAVAVFGIPDEDFGQRLQAVVIPKSNSTLDTVTLRDWLKPRVARYQMPAVIEFRRELPYTALGKLDKKALRQ